jgi:hypothetical protein
MLSAQLFVAQKISKHKDKYVSVLLAELISPRSVMFLSNHPNDFKISFTFFYLDIVFT